MEELQLGDVGAGAVEEPAVADTDELMLKELADYYLLPEELEGELVECDEESRTYRTGEKQYTTVIEGYVGTYKDEGEKVQLVDNTLTEAEQAEEKRQRLLLTQRSQVRHRRLTRT